MSEPTQSQEKTWRDDVLEDINEFVGKSDQIFKECAARSFKRAPLVECHADVYKGYSGALVDLFFHLFRGFVGPELDMEENLITDLRARFADARAEEFAKKVSQPGPTPIKPVGG